MGWEPEERTAHVYVPVVWWKPWTWARATLSIKTREPEWDDEQRTLALAFGEHKRGIGPNGELLSEATSERADPNYYGEDAIRYVPRGPFTNQAEKKRLDAIDAYKKEAGEKANLNGLYWTIERVGQATDQDVIAE